MRRTPAFKREQRKYKLPYLNSSRMQEQIQPEDHIPPPPILEFLAKRHIPSPGTINVSVNICHFVLHYFLYSFRA